MARRISDQFHCLDRRLHLDWGGHSKWVWAIPASGFAVWAATLLVMGVITGLSAAEFIPTALIEGLVLGGLFVICLTPESVPDDDDGGIRVPDTEPPLTPPTPDHSVWLTLLAELDTEPAPADEEHAELVP